MRQVKAMLSCDKYLVSGPAIELINPETDKILAFKTVSQAEYDAYVEEGTIDRMIEHFDNCMDTEQNLTRTFISFLGY